MFSVVYKRRIDKFAALHVCRVRRQLALVVGDPGRFARRQALDCLPPNGFLSTSTSVAAAAAAYVWRIRTNIHVVPMWTKPNGNLSREPLAECIIPRRSPCLFNSLPDGRQNLPPVYTRFRPILPFGRMASSTVFRTIAHRLVTHFVSFSCCVAVSYCRLYASHVTMYAFSVFNRYEMLLFVAMNHLSRLRTLTFDLLPSYCLLW